jgi:hypothetical protein
MLEVSPETVCFFIDKAREFHAKEEVVIPDMPDSPAEDWGLQVLADHAEDSTLQEFKSTFDDLEPDQQQQVVALLWMGRGDFGVDEWEVAVDEARENWTNETAEYLIAHPMLADYLLEGLTLLGYSCD